MLLDPVWALQLRHICRPCSAVMGCFIALYMSTTGLYNCCLCELGMSGVQLYEDSRDNYKILRTLERHFGAIAGSPVPGIPQMLLPMFNALRLVWAISTHYSDDTHMCALLQRIAHALCDRAQHSVVIQASP